MEPTGAIMSARIERGPAWSNRTPTKLVEGRYFHVAINAAATGRTYDVSPDGRRFLMIKFAAGSEQTAAPTKLVVVLNWAEELKRLVPSGSR